MKDSAACADVASSPQRIQEALNTMQLALVPTSQGDKYVKVKPHALAQKIFKISGLKMPGNISTKDDLIDRFQLDTKPGYTQMSIL